MGRARCWEPNISRRICSPGGLRSLSGSSRDKPPSQLECFVPTDSTSSSKCSFTVRRRSRVQLIESVDALPCSLFVQRSLEHGKRLSRMGHSAGGVDPRGDAEGHVARIRLGWIGARGFEQLLQSFVPRSGELGETQPGESSCTMRAAAHNRRSKRSLHIDCTRTTDARPSYRSSPPSARAPTQTSQPGPLRRTHQTILLLSLPAPGCGGDRSRRRRFPAVAPIARPPAR